MLQQESTGRHRGVQRRPGGRTAQHTTAIFDATMQLLVELGFPSLSFQAVAERAGVSRATMYRRWPTTAALAVDAIRARAETEIAIPDTGSLADDLIDVLGAIDRFVTSPVGRASLAAGLQLEPDSDPTRSWSTRWQQVEPIFARAVDRGELSADVDAEALFAAAAGSVYFRMLVMGMPADATWIRRIIASVVREHPGA
ncbi:MAG: hypothetical protein RL238_3060 [Actinomycetota bacterium]